MFACNLWVSYILWSSLVLVLVKPGDTGCTSGKMSTKGCCVFPMVYNGTVYNGCTSEDHHLPWCYISNGDWGNCLPLPASALYPSNYTCQFFRGDGQGNGGDKMTSNQQESDCIETCVKLKRTDSQINGVTVFSNTSKGGCWCKRQMRIIERKDSKFRTCFLIQKKERCSSGKWSTKGCCVFPMVYKRIVYSGCASEGHDRPWCYNSNGDWGSCLPLPGNATAIKAPELVGIWDTEWENGDKGTYNISADGRVVVLNCTWNCPIKSAFLEASDSEAYPSSEGWYKVDDIHRTDVYLYIRLSPDRRLEVHYRCHGCSNKADKAMGIRRKDGDTSVEASAPIGNDRTNNSNRSVLIVVVVLVLLVIVAVVSGYGYWKRKHNANGSVSTDRNDYLIMSTDDDNIDLVSTGIDGGNLDNLEGCSVDIKGGPFVKYHKV